MKDGQRFTIFRRLQIEEKNENTDGYTVFVVRFKFKGLEFETNKRFSIIPAPFLMGMEGFLEKDWTFNNNTGYFQGIYQWESEKLAKSYPDSFIFKLMTKRAVPGTVSYEILPNTDLTEYLRLLLSE